ncbi:MAG: alanine--tRNA ligase, partial [Deltaproteobacteria bacterium]|nr:alanine--tRNA ligase [Deltaproteobacteria bacterium]
LKHVSKDRIFRLGEKDNFWAMGETGPCGPCSEIHYDRNPSGKVAKKDLESSRFMEVWNLVFMQFERDGKGRMKKLAKPSIDTGMGLERLAAVVGGVEGNYETDLFKPIIGKIEEITGKRYERNYSDSMSFLRKQESSVAREIPAFAGTTTATDFSIRVIADHISAGTFLVGDGVQPSNEGRGYVLRRIIRRAIRHGKMLGLDKPFFAPIAHVVIDEMGSAYPELIQHRAFIEKVITNEEERFYSTLSTGLEILDAAFAEIKKKNQKVIPGEIVFKLYDTYGFPKDLTRDVAAEQGFTIDDSGFEKSMSVQREKARAAWKGSGEEHVDAEYKELQKKGIKTKFVAYEKETCEGRVLAIVAPPPSPSPSRGEGKGEGDSAIQFITDSTSFYGESGGQIGDTGVAVGDGVEITVTGAKKPLLDLIVHEGIVEKGELKKGQKLTLAVDSERRADIKRNHTATHLLHKALRATLGEHVKQAGSYVAPDSFRFDFSHFQSLKEDEIKDIEAQVNNIIRKNLSVTVSELSYDDAVKRGALAFFGEKYGAKVRLVEVEGYSMELCGGTHVGRTGDIGMLKILDIGMLKILSESSVAAGVRRIEAVTGRGVEEYFANLEAQLKSAAQELKSGVNEVPSRISKLLERLKQLEKQLESGQTSKADAKIEDINGTKIICSRVECPNINIMRALSDQYKQKIGSGVVVLGSVINERVSLIVSVTKDLTQKYNAGDIVKKLSALVGGTGGGRPDMAQGGGAEISMLDEALAAAKSLISNH